MKRLSPLLLIFALFGCETDNGIPLTNRYFKLVEIRIVDEDLNLPDDYEIFFWTFHALEDGGGGNIDFFDNEKLVMTLNYNEK